MANKWNVLKRHIHNLTHGLRESERDFVISLVLAFVFSIIWGATKK